MENCQLKLKEAYQLNTFLIWYEYIRFKLIIMRSIIMLITLGVTFASCITEDLNKINNADWNSRFSDLSLNSEYDNHTSYLPVYSHIYHTNDKRRFDLAITISMRNVSDSDTLHLLSADYYNTSGDKVREYIKTPIYVLPMETIEIVISDSDNEGGSGANFNFNWVIKDEASYPIFQAVMISTEGQQGISFVTSGIITR